MKDIEKHIMLGKVYGMIQCITDNYLNLKLPVIVRVSMAKRFRYSAEYNLCDSISKKGLREYHKITIGYWLNHDNDGELFDTVAHELLHAEQAEKDSTKE